MAIGTTILCLVLFVVVCCAQDLNIVIEGDIHGTSTLNFSVPATNLQDDVFFKIEYSAPVVVCVQERFQAPAGNQISNETCTWFWNFTTPTDPGVRIPLRRLDYFFAVYHGHGAVNSTHVKLSITGSSCPNDDCHDPRNGSVPCTKVNPVKPGQIITVSIAEVPGPTLFYQIPIGSDPIIGSVSFTSPNTTDKVNIMMRYEGTPSSAIGHHDSQSSDGVAKFISPRPGNWYIALEFLAIGEYVFNVATLSCPEGTAGDECSTHYSWATENMSLVALPGDKYHYWKYVAEDSMNVSITTFDHKEIPNLYVSQGNIPTKGNADVSNCNQAHCDVVRSIHVPSSPGSVWFISVTSSEAENKTFGIWYNSTCPTHCQTDGHGSCKEDGTCFCQLDFTGIDCTTQKGLGAQYIVLIIIAALVLTSAIIGFVAWAYMRRKRVNYELVS